MYWRIDGALEIAKTGCSNYTAELAALGTGIFLHDDTGALIKHGSYQWDYTNAKGVGLLKRALVNTVNQTLPDGAPAMDYLYLDGASFFGDESGISVARNAVLRAAKKTWLSELQTTFDGLPGGGRNIILNGMDGADVAAGFSSTGAAGAMYDHWSILQYLQRGPKVGCGGQKLPPANLTCGEFDPVAMEGGFQVSLHQYSSSVVSSCNCTTPTLPIKSVKAPRLPVSLAHGRVEPIATTHHNTHNWYTLSLTCSGLLCQLLLPIPSSRGARPSRT